MNLLRDAREAYDIHEALMAWLRATYPAADQFAVMAACSYEIGRLVARLTDDRSPAEIEALIAGVAGVLREHIAVHREIRRGLTRMST